MSDKNVDEKIELNKEEFQDELVSKEQQYTMEELMNSVSTIPPMELDISNLSAIKYDKKEFQAGVNSMSLFAGAITSLINCGLSSHDALDFLVNERTIEMNLKLNAENNKTSIIVSRNQVVQNEKNQI